MYLTESQKKDIELFRKIYEQCSHHIIPKEEVQEMQKMYRKLYALRAIVNGLQKAEKMIQPIKHFFSKKKRQIRRSFYLYFFISSLIHFWAN